MENDYFTTPGSDRRIARIGFACKAVEIHSKAILGIASITGAC
jgi:hypothetical protein